MNYLMKTFMFLFYVVLATMILSTALKLDKLESDIRQQNIDEYPMKENNIQGTHIFLNMDDFYSLEEYKYDIGNFYGNSMQPTLFEGNKLIMMALPDNYLIKSGDIVRFKNDYGNYTVHRVEANYRDYIVTKGDNSKKREYTEIEYVTHIIVGVIYT